MAARNIDQDGDEARVRIVERAYDRAWSAGDLDALVKCFTADAVVVNPRGHMAVGTQEIREVLGSFLEDAKASQHESTVERIAFVGNDVAVVDGHAAITSETSAVVHPFTDILFRTESDDWRIAHVRAYYFERHL